MKQSSSQTDKQAQWNRQAIPTLKFKGPQDFIHSIQQTVEVQRDTALRNVLKSVPVNTE